MQSSQLVRRWKQASKSAFSGAFTMGSVARMAVDPQATILEALSKREYLPLELMKHLGDEKQLTDASLKSAILDLLREMRIEFGPDQKLRIRAEAPVAR